MGSFEEEVKGEEEEEEAEKLVAGFTEGERILAVHGDQLYDAKILEAKVQDGEWIYFVHYRGWNKSWDEWLGIDRVLKHTEENIEKQQALRNCINGDKGDSDSYQLRKRKWSSGSAVSIKNRKGDSELKRLDASLETIIDIQLPLSLKKQLVRDWECVTQQEKLLKVPCCPTVDQILSKYLDYMLKDNGMLTDSTAEFLKGLKCYFDKALPTILLYEKEHSQYQETVLDDISPSAVYGAQHLLRLFVKLPDIMVHVNMDKKTSVHFQEILNDFVRFLKKNRATLFTSPYHAFKASEET